VSLLLTALAASAGEGTLKTVADPGGAFTLKVPAGWRVKAKPGSVVVNPEGSLARVAVWTQEKCATLKGAADAAAARLKDGVKGWTEANRKETRLAGRKAIRIQGTGTFKFGMFAQEGAEPMVIETQVAFVGDREIQVMMQCPLADVARLGRSLRDVADSIAIPATEDGPADPPAEQETKPLAFCDGLFRIAVPRSWKVAEKEHHVEAKSPDDSMAFLIARFPKHGQFTLDQCVTKVLGIYKGVFADWKAGERASLTLAGQPAVRVSGTCVKKMMFDIPVPCAIEHFVLRARGRLLWITIEYPEGQRETFRTRLRNMVHSLKIQAPERTAEPPTHETPDTPHVTRADEPPQDAPPRPPRPKPMKELKSPDDVLAFPVPEDWNSDLKMGGGEAVSPDLAARVQYMLVPRTYGAVDVYAKELIKQWKMNVRGWKLRRQQKVQFGGRPAIYINAATISEKNVPMVVEYTIANLEASWLIFVVVCEKEHYERWKPVLHKIIRGLRLLPPEEARPDSPWD
jgi:hypothetical protein